MVQKLQRDLSSTPLLGSLSDLDNLLNISQTQHYLFMKRETT